MNCVTINISALLDNIRTINRWISEHGATWTLVTKVLCGHLPTLRQLTGAGVRSMADSRLANLQAIQEVDKNAESWYVRLPHLRAINDIVRLSSVSLNTELEIITALNHSAEKHGKKHGVVIMIELGDLREGILPGSLLNFYSRVLTLPHIRVLGIGANIGCLSAVIPNLDQLTHLVLYRELLELKFNRKMPLISGGSSILLPMLLQKRVPKAINHFRIGEAVFLGTDLVNGGTLPGLRDDAVTVSADIVEIKEKGLVPLGETTHMAPFELFQQDSYQPNQRGYRAIVTIGQLDTDVKGLTPVNPNYQIAGASSDLSVINTGDNPDGLKLGKTISFKPTYSALLRLMAGKYFRKQIVADSPVDGTSSSDPSQTELLPRILDGTSFAF